MYIVIVVKKGFGIFGVHSIVLVDVASLSTVSIVSSVRRNSRIGSGFNVVFQCNIVLAVGGVCVIVGDINPRFRSLY